MATGNLPLNTWIVAPSRERPALISTHDCQRAAEVECDRRNRASPEHPYQALLEPIAERMGGQYSPTAPSWHSR